MSGVGIVDQLISSEPHLYKASDVAPASDAAGSLAEEPKLSCEVTHECENCGTALFMIWQVHLNTLNFFFLIVILL